MRIDPSWRHECPVSVDNTPSPGVDYTDRTDQAAIDGDITRECGTPRAIDNRPSPDDQVMHTASSRTPAAHLLSTSFD
jgi:hypothetical protein